MFFASVRVESWIAKISRRSYRPVHQFIKSITQGFQVHGVHLAAGHVDIKECAVTKGFCIHCLPVVSASNLLNQIYNNCKFKSLVCSSPLCFNILGRSGVIQSIHSCFSCNYVFTFLSGLHVSTYFSRPSSDPTSLLFCFAHFCKANIGFDLGLIIFAFTQCGTFFKKSVD